MPAYTYLYVHRHRGVGYRPAYDIKVAHGKPFLCASCTLLSRANRSHVSYIHMLYREHILSREHMLYRVHSLSREHILAANCSDVSYIHMCTFVSLLPLQYVHACARAVRASLSFIHLCQSIRLVCFLPRTPLSSHFSLSLSLSLSLSRWFPLVRSLASFLSLSLARPLCICLPLPPLLYLSHLQCLC